MLLIETSAREWIKTARTKFVEISGAHNLFLSRPHLSILDNLDSQQVPFYVSRKELLYSIGMNHICITYIALICTINKFVIENF